jgi:hypothetical protein
MRTITPGSLNKGEQIVIPIFVPANVELWALDLSTAVTSTGSLDLLLFACADGHCQLSRETRGMPNPKRLALRQPKSGQWKMVVDGTYATQLETDFSLDTVFISSSYGEVASDDPVNSRATGAKWSASVRPILRAAIPANARPVLPIYFDDLINGSLHAFKSPKAQFGEEDHREPRPLGLQLVDWMA